MDSIFEKDIKELNLRGHVSIYEQKRAVTEHKNEKKKV
jgi:hypothetical protein